MIREGGQSVTDYGTIRSQSDIAALYEPPHPLVVAKQRQALDAHDKALIGLSPFLILSTADRSGCCDSSPRGDSPGFVAILDDRTLLIPDRPGNNRLDSLRNIVENPHVGLLFMVPGLTETLRVNGTAAIVADPDRLTAFAIRGRRPKSGVLVTVEEVFFHCGKALIRSRLWQAEAQIDPRHFASLGRILVDQVGGVPVEVAESIVAENYRTELY